MSHSIGIRKQEPLVLLDYTGNLAVSSSLTKAVPCVGLVFVSGLIYSSKAISLTISEGVASGVPTYRYSRAYSIVAGDTLPIEWPLHGKYIQVVLTNSSPTDVAAIESFLILRGIE